MITIILAGVLVALSIAVYLLFRQLRDLSWQLTVLRVERDSERIMRALKGAPYHQITADNRPLPAHRKRHLTLYVGGAVAVLVRLGSKARHSPPTVAAAAVTAVAAVAALAVLVILQNPGGPARSPATGHSSVGSPTGRPGRPGETKPATQGASSRLSSSQAPDSLPAGGESPLAGEAERTVASTPAHTPRAGGGGGGGEETSLSPPGIPSSSPSTAVSSPPGAAQSSPPVTDVPTPPATEPPPGEDRCGGLDLLLLRLELSLLGRG